MSSKIDSRTILDQGGAESLLGMGDMLYMPAGTSNPTRVHGAFVDDHEVHKVVADWKLRGEPDYIDEILSGESDGEGGGGDFGGGGDEELDPLFDEAVAFVVESRRGSTSSVQRKFKIGYNLSLIHISLARQQAQEGDQCAGNRGHCCQDCPYSVSYTHLDVYKRQRHTMRLQRMPRATASKKV